MKILVLSAALASALSMNYARAEVVDKNHRCSRPIAPLSKDQFAKQAYVDAIVSYADCLKAFAAENEAAASEHLKAAKQAREEWELFMNSEPLFGSVPRSR